MRGHGERGDGGNPGEEAEDDETHPVQNHGCELPITLSAESRESYRAVVTRLDTSAAAYDPSVSESVFTFTEKAPTKAFSWLNI